MSSLFLSKSGNPATCLKDPRSVLITDSIARQYFPNENPIGKTIGLIDKSEYRLPVFWKIHLP